MAYLNKDITYVNAVQIGKKQYNYMALEKIIRNYGNHPVIEKIRLSIDYFNARGDIKVKFLNWRTLQVEKEVAVRYYP